jgi:hypothetical protein
MAPEKRSNAKKPQKTDGKRPEYNGKSKTSKHSAKKPSKITKKEDMPGPSKFYKAIAASERKQACLFLISKDQLRKLEPEFCQQKLCDEIMGPITRENGSLDEQSAAFPIFHGMKLTDPDENALPQANTIPDGGRRDIVFLCIDLTDWNRLLIHEKSMFEDAWFETVRKRVQYIMGWLATLLARFPKLRKISYLLNKDAAMSTRIISYHIQNQNKIGLNPVFVAQREKPKGEPVYVHWIVKRLFNAARTGEISLVKVDGNSSIPENESGSYDPMDTESRWRLPKVEADDKSMAKPDDNMGESDPSAPTIAEMMKTMADSSASALALMTQSAATATSRAEASEANLIAMQAQVDMLVKRLKK